MEASESGMNLGSGSLIQDAAAFNSALYSEIDAEVAECINALDLEEIEATYQEQGQFIFIPEFLSPSLRGRLSAELQNFTKDDIRRVQLPFVRRGGAIGQERIVPKAPQLDAFYRSPSLVQLIRKLSQMPLSPKAIDDGHGATLLYYQKKGDYCANHYDGCACKGNENFTMSLGLVQKAVPHSEYYLFRRDKSKATQKITKTLGPGAAVFYRGDQIYHGVTPLKAEEERIVYSLTYSKVTARPSGIRLLRHKINDAMIFGFFRKN